MSKTGNYIVPAATIIAATTPPSDAWTVEPSSAGGMYVIYGKTSATQMHANKDTRLINWGYNTSGSGPRKDDAGCCFAFVEADGMAGTGIDHPGPKSQDPGLIYDLQGRRVGSPTRGVYIVNRQKVMIK